MNTLNVRAVSGGLILLFITACGSAALPGAPSSAAASDAHRPASARRAASASNGVLFVADSANDQIMVLSLTGQRPYSQIATIQSGVNQPMPVTTDKAGNLYVGNLGDNTVKEYLHGAKTPSVTVKNVYAPLGLAIDAKGNLWVSQRPSANAYFGVVDEYAYNAKSKTFATKPSETLSGTGIAALVAPHGLTFDSAGNLFIADPSRHGYIFEVATGTTTVKAVELPKITPFQTGGPTAIEGPYDVKVSGSGTQEALYVDDGILGGVYNLDLSAKKVTWSIDAGGGGANETYIAVDSAGGVFDSVSNGSVIAVNQVYPTSNMGMAITGSYVPQGLATASSF
jgi:hypothetical protein